VAYGNGIGYGFSPYGYGSYGVGYGGFGSFPMPGFAEALGVIPQTTIAVPGLSYGVTAVPGWTARAGVSASIGSVGDAEGIPAYRPGVRLQRGESGKARRHRHADAPQHPRAQEFT